MIGGPIGVGKSNTLMSEYSLKLSEAVLRKRTFAAERAARIETDIANRVKSEFISNMSHELRTPLNTVIGFSKLLAEGDRRRIKEQDVIEYARLIQDAANHLLSVINDILDISKIRSGRYTIEAREVGLEEVLEAVGASFRQMATDAQVTMSLQLSPEPMLVRGDQAKLKQAFANLVSNAIKFTRAGGSIEVAGLTMSDGSILVSIRDTGIGMDTDELGIALTPFGQVDGGHTRWREGTGLGLSIAISLIELHGGRVDIQSTKGVGTEVAVHLPSPRFVSIVKKPGATLGEPANMPTHRATG